MSRLIKTICICFLFLYRGNAAGQDLDLHNYSASTYNNFARLSGQLIGSGLYHTAGIHKFGGVDFGVKTMLGFIPKENRIGPLTGADIVPIPILQANIGLVKGFEAGGRFFKFKFGDRNAEEVTIASGVIKYNALKGLVFPDITFYSAYSRLTGVTDFSLNIYTIGGMLGKSLPLLTLYAGGNYNISRLNVKLSPIPRNYPDGYKRIISQNVFHYSVGMSLGLTPFTKVNAEFNVGKVKTITVGIILSIF